MIDPTTRATLRDAATARQLLKLHLTSHVHSDTLATRVPHAVRVQQCALECVGECKTHRSRPTT